MSYDNSNPWPPLSREAELTAQAAAHWMRPLPSPQDRRPPMPHTDPQAMARAFAPVRLRSLTSSRYFDGRVLAVGEVFELPRLEARGWIQHGWAEAV
jgi:hypothetical protein